MPCAIAPAWPLVPPPTTLIETSNLRCVPVTRSGASAAISSTRRPRYARGSLSLTVTRPSPGVSRTRAIAFLRRPVPRFGFVSANLQISFCVEGESLRSLSGVAVLRAGVDAKALEHVGAEGVALQHPADRGRDRERRVELLSLLQAALAQAAGVARVARVLLGLHLGARHLDLGGVDDDHMVPGVQVRGVRGLVLATQDRGHTAGQAAEHLVCRIDDIPVTLQICGFRRPRLLFAHHKGSLDRKSTRL